MDLPPKPLLLPRGRLRGLLLYFFPYCHPIGPLLLAPPTSNTLTDQIMSAQRLYELDRSSIQFPEQLDGLLRDKEWVEQLKFLPEHELVELAGHLHDVWLISTPTRPTHRPHRFSMFSTPGVHHSESASVYCRKFAVRG